jgi:hypothetical protein
MPRSLCLIGNSHLVALQSALAADPDGWPDLTMRFHGFRGRTVLETAFEGGVMVPLTDTAREQMQRYSGTETLDLGGFDAFVVVGLNVKILPTLTLRKESRWPALPSLRTVADIAALEQTLISDLAALVTLSLTLQGTAGFVLAARLRAAFGKPVYVIGHPCLHPAAGGDRYGLHYGIPRTISAGDGSAVNRLFRQAVNYAAKAVEVTFLHQPTQTLRHALWTDPAFMAGQQPDGRMDLGHPNAAYGALMLNALAQAVAA